MIEAARRGAARSCSRRCTRARFDKPWSAAEIAKLMENQAVFAIVTATAEPQGFVMAWAAAGDAELLTVAVVPEARRKGVGAALVTAAGVTALVRGAASMHLEVAEDNAAARALYAQAWLRGGGRRTPTMRARAVRLTRIVMRRTLPRPMV